MQCYHLTGQYDYLLKVALRDMNDYYYLVFDKLAKLADVGTVTSNFVPQEAKHTGPVPIKMPTAGKQKESLVSDNRRTRFDLGFAREDIVGKSGSLQKS